MSFELPISVKGIVFEGDSVWLRKNERDEWELPGGKMDPGEQPEETVKRELLEELGFEAEVKKLVHTRLYKIEKSSDESGGVLVLIYLCKLTKKVGEFETEGESGKVEFKKFKLDEIENLNMPQFYKDAIKMSNRMSDTRC